MVGRGGGEGVNGRWGKKKLRIREKNEEGERKTERGLKNASFWDYKLQKNSALPPQTYSLGEGCGEGMIEMHNIYPCFVINLLHISFIR